MSWFPLRRDMMESTEFQKLTPTEKVIFWCMLSEFNMSGRDPARPFYKSDAHFAASVGVSMHKVREARRKFQSRGWVKVKPGTMIGSRGLATIYLALPWAEPPQAGDGVFFASMHRYAFDAMLARVRWKKIRVQDLVVYVTLRYLFWHNGRSQAFFVPKAKLQKLTGLSSPLDSVRRLYSEFAFGSGAHLFEFEDRYQNIAFAAWSEFEDPSDSEDTRKRLEKFREEIGKATLQLRSAATGSLLSRRKDSVPGRQRHS